MNSSPNLKRRKQSNNYELKNKVRIILCESGLSLIQSLIFRFLLRGSRQISGGYREHDLLTPTRQTFCAQTVGAQHREHVAVQVRSSC